MSAPSVQGGAAASGAGPGVAWAAQFAYCKREDRARCEPDLSKVTQGQPKVPLLAFFAVFDGHNGTATLDSLTRHSAHGAVSTTTTTTRAAKPSRSRPPCAGSRAAEAAERELLGCILDALEAQPSVRAR